MSRPDKKFRKSPVEKFRFSPLDIPHPGLSQSAGITSFASGGVASPALFRFRSR